jgi:hypothetical protein
MSAGRPVSLLSEWKSEDSEVVPPSSGRHWGPMSLSRSPIREREEVPARGSRRRAWSETTATRHHHHHESLKAGCRGKTQQYGVPFCFRVLGRALDWLHAANRLRKATQPVVTVAGVGLYSVLPSYLFCVAIYQPQGVVCRCLGLSLSHPRERITSLHFLEPIEGLSIPARA